MKISKHTEKALRDLDKGTDGLGTTSCLFEGSKSRAILTQLKVNKSISILEISLIIMK